MSAHPVDAMLAEAEAAVARMKQAALEARRLQARAELARHMRTTALKLSAMPEAEAAAAIAREWMKAWALEAAAYAAISPEVHDFCLAFCRDARGSTAATQGEVSRAFLALEAGFGRLGTMLADEMAFRSECAHGWWRMVVPVPSDLRDEARMARIPRPAEDEPFWSAGPQPHCR